MGGFPGGNYLERPSIRNSPIRVYRVISLLQVKKGPRMMKKPALAFVLFLVARLAMLVSGQGMSTFLVNWQTAIPHKRWLQEQSTTRDTLQFTIFG